MSRLEFNFKEIEKEPFMFEVTDRTAQIVAEAPAESPFLLDAGAQH
jgi:hypothetical protein